MSHRFDHLEALSLVLHTSTKDNVHNLLSSYFVDFQSSKLVPGSAIPDGLVSREEESQKFLVLFSLSAHADLVFELLIAFSAGLNRSINAVSILGADLADVFSRFNLEISTVISVDFSETHTCVAESSSLGSVLAEQESGREDHKSDRNEVEESTLPICFSSSYVVFFLFSFTNLLGYRSSLVNFELELSSLVASLSSKLSLFSFDFGKSTSSNFNLDGTGRPRTSGFRLVSINQFFASEGSSIRLKLIKNIFSHFSSRRFIEEVFSLLLNVS